MIPVTVQDLWECKPKQRKRKPVLAVQLDTLEALRELRWRYRCRSLSDVIDLLIWDAEPELFKDVILKDLPEHEKRKPVRVATSTGKATTNGGVSDEGIRPLS